MVEEMAPETLQEKLSADDEVQVVDVRRPGAFERGHLPGALNVPFGRLHREVERIDWGDDVVVVCPHGESSRRAARLIEAYEGVDDDATVANLTGGYDAWEYGLETGED